MGPAAFAVVRIALQVAMRETVVLFTDDGVFLQVIDVVLRLVGRRALEVGRRIEGVIRTMLLLQVRLVLVLRY
jgi:hypothetical protein